jgi:hypothetical protein
LEAIKELQFDIMNEVLLKEIKDFNMNKAQIQIVLKSIHAREECIKTIRSMDHAEN